MNENSLTLQENMTNNNKDEDINKDETINNTFKDIIKPVENNDFFIIPPINKKVTFQNNETDSLIPSIDEILSN